MIKYFGKIFIISLPIMKKKTLYFRYMEIIVLLFIRHVEQRIIFITIIIYNNNRYLMIRFYFGTVVEKCKTGFVGFEVHI